MLIRILGLIAEKEFRRLIVSRSLGGYGIEKDAVIDHELVVKIMGVEENSLPKIDNSGVQATPIQRVLRTEKSWILYPGEAN